VARVRPRACRWLREDTGEIQQLGNDAEHGQVFQRPGVLLHEIQHKVQCGGDLLLRALVEAQVQQLHQWEDAVGGDEALPGVHVGPEQQEKLSSRVQVSLELHVAVHSQSG
jgi:hypothetical protein